MRASKRQKEPSIALIFCKLPVSCALSRRYSWEVLGIEGRRKERPVTVGIGLCGGVVQLVRTPACHAGGRGFESRRSRQHSLTIAPQVRSFQRMRRRLGARRIGKLGPSLNRAGWRAAPASCACATDRTTPLRCCRGTQLIATRRSPARAQWRG
jgi:hypothetical protein